jgi:ankyrin repeat protein
MHEAKSEVKNENGLFRKFLFVLFACYFVIVLQGCTNFGTVQTFNNDLTATPLQRAVGQPDQLSDFKPRAPDFQQVKKLLEGGVDIHEVNGLGSALHSATRYGTKEIVEYLLIHGFDVNIRANSGLTPLMTAAQAGNIKIVELLVSKGADVNAKSRLNYTPLTEAAFGGQYEIVMYLILRGADVGKQSGTAFLRAAEGMKLRLFEKTEASLNNDSVAGDAELDNDIYEFIAIQDIWILKGADVNKVDLFGKNVLHLASNYANPKIMRYLLRAGVNPSVKDKFLGWTPIETARFLRNAVVERINKYSDFNARSDAAKNVALRKLQDSIAGFDEEIAILESATTLPNNDVAVHLDSKDLVVNSDCAKLNVSISVCDQMPWPLSSGCSSLERAQFNNIC